MNFWKLEATAGSKAGAEDLEKVLAEEGRLPSALAPWFLESALGLVGNGSAKEERSQAGC